ncbi:MAG: hypothetical protein P1U58_19025 [Verrucomicrobiales bacterium]|nr:hypothetical protein [Verrucomicrobiales bacterium]
MSFSDELPLLNLAVAGGDGGLVYYAVCAMFFALMGLGCGYFVWRKGHMQTQDAEMEVKRTEAELQALRLDLSEEEKGIRLEHESDDIEKVVP